MKEGTSALLVAACCVMALIALGRVTRGESKEVQAVKLELTDKGDGHFVSIVQPGFRTVYADPKPIHTIILYAEGRAPDKNSPHPVYLIGPGSYQFRVDCQTADEAEQIIDFIKRNQ